MSRYKDNRERTDIKMTIEPTPQTACPDLGEKVEFLRRSDIYPDEPDQVETIETHTSWLFLTGRYVYKLKKPLRYDFLDFSTVEARRQNCQAEVRLNRRLSRGVYLGTVSLTLDPREGMNLGGPGRVIDWLVEMHRLAKDRELELQIKDHAVHKEDIVKVAQVLARFYETSLPVDMNPSQYLGRFDRDLSDNRRELTRSEFGLATDWVEQIAHAQRIFLDNEAALFRKRVQEGRIIEAHGDLRPEHIYLGTEPVIIDCLEFNREFRTLDCVDELAFLAMECERLGAPFIGEIVFATYNQVTSDHPPQKLLDFYMSYRAFLWAKLAIWHTGRGDDGDHSKWVDKTNTYLRLAEAHIQKALGH